jgi:hypothetical protein
MLITHGGKAIRFDWIFQGDQITITNEKGRMHVYPVSEIFNIINLLTERFGDGWFPLGNNVAKLGKGTEVEGLGTAILRQQPKNITHAQGSSYLGLVLEHVGIFEWNNKAWRIKWRTIYRPRTFDELRKIMNAKTA